MIFLPSEETTRGFCEVMESSGLRATQVAALVGVKRVIVEEWLELARRGSINMPVSDQRACMAFLDQTTAAHRKWVDRQQAILKSIGEM